MTLKSRAIGAFEAAPHPANRRARAAVAWESDVPRAVVVVARAPGLGVDVVVILTPPCTFLWRITNGIYSVVSE